MANGERAAGMTMSPTRRCANFWGPWFLRCSTRAKAKLRPKRADRKELAPIRPTGRGQPAIASPRVIRQSTSDISSSAWQRWANDRAISTRDQCDRPSPVHNHWPVLCQHAPGTTRFRRGAKQGPVVANRGAFAFSASAGQRLCHTPPGGSGRIDDRWLPGRQAASSHPIEFRRIDNTRVFRAMATALGLGQAK